MSGEKKTKRNNSSRTKDYLFLTFHSDLLSVEATFYICVYPSPLCHCCHTLGLIVILASIRWKMFGVVHTFFFLWLYNPKIFLYTEFRNNLPQHNFEILWFINIVNPSTRYQKNTASFRLIRAWTKGRIKITRSFLMNNNNICTNDFSSWFRQEK